MIETLIIKGASTATKGASPAPDRDHLNDRAALMSVPPNAVGHSPAVTCATRRCARFVDQPPKDNRDRSGQTRPSDLPRYAAGRARYLYGLRRSRTTTGPIGSMVDGLDLGQRL